VTAATAPVPSPLAITAAVSNDVLSRTLVVRLPETEKGYSRLLWREAFAAYSRLISPLRASSELLSGANSVRCLFSDFFCRFVLSSC
jgi:hypothetical protein